MTMPKPVHTKQTSTPFVYLITLVLGLICNLVAYLLIITVDVESVVVTGGFELVLGLFILIIAITKNHWPGVVVGSAMIGIVILLVMLVNLFRWSPAEAAIPFYYIGGFFVTVTTPFYVIAIRTVPPNLQAWQCPGCGYAIYGLSSSQCPECGHALDPALVRKYREGMPT